MTAETEIRRILGQPPAVVPTRAAPTLPMAARKQNAIAAEVLGRQLPSAIHAENSLFIAKFLME